MNERNVLVAGDIVNDKTDMDSNLKNLPRAVRGEKGDSY